MRPLLQSRSLIREIGVNPSGIYRGKLAEPYDGIGQYVSVTLAGSSTGAAYKGRISTGDFGGGRTFPRGTPVVVFSWRGNLEVMLGNRPQETISCPAIFSELEVQFAGSHQFGGINFGPVTGDAITALEGSPPTLTMIGLSINSFEISLGGVSVSSPWTMGTEKPGNIGGSHSETGVAWLSSNNPSTPTIDWFNYAYGWRQVSLPIRTSATAPRQEATVNGLGGVTWPLGDPLPDSLLYLFRVGEGPTLWTSDPFGAGWELFSDEVYDGTGATGSQQVWLTCASTIVGSSLPLNTGAAGSAWWPHLFEIPITI